MQGKQLALFSEAFEERSEPAVHERSSSFVDNMGLPIHRWFRYSAGFSAQFMIAAYFGDLAKVWKALRRVTSQGSRVCFVVGDSAPYGVYVPVDRWLGELALAAGFHSYSFEKTRDRNIRWHNRKHCVPLHEGRLWVEG